MTAALLLSAVAGATPLLYLSVDSAGPTPMAHLSIWGAEEVELSLYELPPDPSELFAKKPARSQGAAPAWRPPSPVANLEKGRRDLLASAAELQAGLSKPAVDLFKAWFGLQTALVNAMPEVPEAEVAAKGDLVRAWRVDAPEPGWNYSDIDLGPLAAGVYSLVMRSQGAWVRATVPVSQLTVLCARTTASVTVLVQRRESGIPLPGAEVLAEPGDHPVLLGRTAADGVLTVRNPPSDSLVVRLGRELALLHLPAVSRGGDTDAAGAVSLDRRVAQPGGAVGVWTLFRSVGPEGHLSIPDSARAELQLVDREGRMLLTQPLTLSALGLATAALEIPAGLAAGDYSVAVAVGDDRRATDLTLVDPGPPQLSLSCEPVAADSADQGTGARCLARDGLGRPEPGVAVRWRLEGPLAGPTEAGSAGAGITGAGGEIEVRAIASPGGQWLRAEASDALGRSAAASLSLPDRSPVHLTLRPARRLLRPGRSATLTLEANGPGEPFHGRLRITATSVRAGPSGESQATPLFERWLETDAHGHASLSLTSSSPGYIELSAVTQPAGGSAHATLFVTENGGDVPATPERLTILPEIGERRRGEETRLLVLTPFEAGTVLLSFEPPSLPTLAVAVHGYSGVARFTLPGGSGPFTAVAAAFRGGRSVTDRLLLLRSPRPLPLAIRAIFDRPGHAAARAAVSLEATDEQGRPLASQVTVLASAGEGPPPLAELLAAPQTAVAIGNAELATDSLTAAPPLEPQTTVPFGPGRVEAEEPLQSGVLETVAVPTTGRLTIAAPSSGSEDTLTLLAAAGPEEIGEGRLRGQPGPSGRARPAAPFIRAGDLPAEARGNRMWPSASAWAGSLAQAIADLLGAPPATGPSADLGCAAVRAVGALSSTRASARGPLARLAQLENLEGGFGESAGELRRDEAALRGLRALGDTESDLLTRTRARIGTLADDMETDDPERAIALAEVSSATPAVSQKLDPDELRSASAPELSRWLSGHRPSRLEQQLAAARVRQLIGNADVLDLAELAVAAQKLSLRLGSSSGGPSVARQIYRLEPSAWTQAMLEADEEPADPVRAPITGPVRLGDELEVQLTAPLAGRGTFCLRDFPPAGATPEGFAPASETIVLCGEPSRGVLQLSYRLRASALGRYQAPAPAFGVERPPAGQAPEWIEVVP